MSTIDSALDAFHDKPMDGLVFCRLAYDLFEEIANQPDGAQMLRKRERTVKKLLEEIFPICRYVQTYYGPGRYMSVRWAHGEQSYDAKVETTGALVSHGMWPARCTLEVTQAVHKNEHLMRERLNTSGGGFGLDGLKAGKGKPGAREIESLPTGFSNQSYIGEMCAIVVKAISAKVLKLANGDYPDDTTLIVDCALITIFLPSEWEALIALVKANIPENGFVRIFVTANSGGYFATL